MQVSFDMDSGAFNAALAAALAALAKSAADEPMRVAEEAAEIARRLAPKLTGELAGSIEARKVGPNEAEFVAGSDHARFVEYGTSDTPTQPFMRPARAQVERDLGQGIHY